MKIQENYPLKNLNSFGFDVYAKFFTEFNNTNELIEVLEQSENEKHLVLGGGSNVLFTEDYRGWILKNNIKGIDIISEDDDSVTLKVGAGENWHEFVLYCIQNDWSGIENMSLIPGVVGAAPIQNIGAYGVEQKDVFIELEVLNKETLQKEIIIKSECQFGYRDSIFKREVKGKYVILNVTYRLLKKSEINISYGAINDVLKERKIDFPTIKDVSDVVISIRESKLPNPKQIGNAGSFFKNPVISKFQFEELLKIDSEAKYYDLGNEEYKIPAGWLIEMCGYKGKKFGEVGVHENQALVLVNYGSGNGKEIFDLSDKIITDVTIKYGIQLEREVNII